MKAILLPAAFAVAVTGLALSSMPEDTHTQLFGESRDVRQGCRFIPGEVEEDVVLE